MPALDITHEGVLFRNPEPGIRALCAYLPNLVPLSDEELLCVFRRGQAFYSLDGRVGQVRSTDGGRTWTDESAVWNPDPTAARFTFTAPHGSVVGDGTVLLLVQRHPADDDELVRFNPATGGMRPTEVVLHRSTDGGRTWSPAEVLDLGDQPATDTPSSIIELADGRWFLGCEAWKPWDDASPLHIRGFAMFSRDRGATWGDRLDFPSAADPTLMFSHSRYTRMRDGSIGALQWTQSIGGHENLDLHLVSSDPTGRTWSRPRPTGIAAQTSWLADLSDGLLAAAYTVRSGMQPGIFVALSADAGRTLGSRWRGDGLGCRRSGVPGGHATSRVSGEP